MNPGDADAPGGPPPEAGSHPPRIRRAVSADSDAVLRLARELATSFTVDPQAFRRSFAEVLADPAAYLAVAEVEGAVVVGYVLGFTRPTFYANGPVAWVEEVMVEPGHRRGGIGTRLMDAAEGWARDRGCPLIALATRRAAAFYGALGYEESAVYFRKRL